MADKREFFIVTSKQLDVSDEELTGAAALAKFQAIVDDNIPTGYSDTVAQLVPESVPDRRIMIRVTAEVIDERDYQS